MAGDDDWQRQVIERAKELDHEHRRRARPASESSLARVLSLRLLRVAVRRLFPGRMRSPAREVAHPAPGHIAVTFVGHASVMLTTPSQPAYHRSVSGRVSPRRAAPRGGLPGEGGRGRGGPGFDFPRPPRSTASADLAQALAAGCDRGSTAMRFAGAWLGLCPRGRAGAGPVDRARGSGDHGRGCPSRRPPRPHRSHLALGDRLHREVRGCLGVLRGGHGLFFRLRGDWPPPASGRGLLPIAGYEPPSQRADHMSPLDALQAFHDLGPNCWFPSGTVRFPVGYEPIDEPLAWLARLCQERGLGDRLVVLRPGETCHVHGRPPESPITPDRP
jgi:hypothetical protein